MKTWLAFSISASLLAGLAGSPVARADSTDATCEVRKDGERQNGKSGPCTFGQRQGYIDIDLRNGETYSLSPRGGANQYRDQKGNKVVRTQAGGNSQEFKWEGGKKVTVRFNGSSYGNHNGYGTAGAYGAGNFGSQSSEYQRGYNDGRRGSWDQNKHNQDYKDGYRAGEQSSGGGNSGGRNSGDGDYYINRLNNGGFEVVWSTHGCVGTFTRDGEPLGYSNSCTNSQTQRSSQIAKRER